VAPAGTAALIYEPLQLQGVVCTADGVLLMVLQRLLACAGVVHVSPSGV